MARLSKFHGNCGMRILHRLDDNPSRMVKQVQRAVAKTPRMGFYNGQFGLVVFTDNDRKPCRGHNLAKFIKQNDIGRVTQSRYIRNPNSIYKIATWQWEIDRARLEAFNADL